MVTKTKEAQNVQNEKPDDTKEKYNFEDLIDISEDIIMDAAHVTGLIKKEKIDMDRLIELTQNRQITTKGKKGELDREITELATILKERYDYTIDIDRAVNMLWNLEKTGMFGSVRDINVYYWIDPAPVLFRTDPVTHDGKNLIVLAPKILSE